MHYKTIKKQVRAVFTPRSFPHTTTCSKTDIPHERMLLIDRADRLKDNPAHVGQIKFLCAQINRIYPYIVWSACESVNTMLSVPSHHWRDHAYV